MAHQTHRYRFGEFEVEPGANELRRSGQAIHLEPKVFQVLMCLIENPGRVVEKSELLDLAWNETYISDNALTKAIGRLRQALGDDAQDARFIQTVHSVGYRFIANVEKIAPETPGISSGTAPRQRLSRLWVPAAAVLLIATIAMIFGLRRGPFRPPRAEAEMIRSLAVLPLKNLTGDPEQDYLAGAIHDTLIGELSRIAPLRVISRQSTLRYRDADTTVPEIAGELDVDALVEGSVMRSGDRVRVTAQLIHGAEDEHLWSGSFDRGQGNVLQLVSDLAEAIADEIHVTLGEEQTTPLRRWRLPSPEAEDSFLRARYFLSTGTRGGLARAAELFEEITELHPGFAPAWAGRSGVSFLQGMLGHVPHSQAAAECARTTERALELDPGLPEALSGAGMAKLYFDWDWPAAGEALARAVKLRPYDALIRHGYGDYLLIMGRLEDSLEQVELGRQYDPASPIAVVAVAGHLMFLGRFEEAADLAEALLAADPDIPLARNVLISALWEIGEREKALELLEARWRRRDSRVADALIRGRLTGGPAGAMLAMGEALAERNDGRRFNPIQVAELFARGGDADRAFEFLDRAFEERLPALLHVSVIPSLTGLHPDPRFSDLVRRIGLPPLDSSPVSSPAEGDGGFAGERPGTAQADAVDADR